MIRNLKYRRFVIFSGPKRRASPGTRFIAIDGSTTSDRSKAVKFLTRLYAKEFADQQGIELGALAYIAQEDFLVREVG